jgi:hypothetical protein
VATSLNGNAAFASLFTASAAPNGDLAIAANDASSMPSFSVQPVDAGAVSLFGADPFKSSHLVTDTKVAVERIDAKMQELLTSYISVDPSGYFTFTSLIAGQYRPRAVPHYTGAPYSNGFGREVTIGDGSVPFTTIWVAGGENAVAVSGSVSVASGLLRTVSKGGGYWIVYVDALDDPATNYPADSLGPRGVTRRSGYYFGSANAPQSGTWNVGRLERGRSYRISIHAHGYAPATVDITIPANATGSFAAPNVVLTPEP